MTRLPTIGADGNTWGGVLNDFLRVAHNSDGTLKNLFINVKDSPYGAVGDGATDDTAAISAARAAARAAGGGTIIYPPGTYISSNQDISNDVFVYHEGAGVGATVVKLKNGANTDLFSAQTASINLAGGSSGRAQGTLYNFGFSKMTLDGNRANQSGGPSYPLRIYGYSFKHSDLEIRNGYSGNWLNDWGGGNNFASDSMEAQIRDVKCHGSGGIGVEYNGPHDSQFANFIDFLDASHCLHLCPGAAGTMFKNLHAYSPANNGNRVTVLASDSFQRANQSGWGSSWAAHGGPSTLSIVSDAGVMSGSSAATFLTFGAGTTTDCQLSGGVNQGADLANNYPGIVWHYTDTNNYYNVYLNGGLLYYDKRVAGTGSNVATVTFTTTTNTWYYLRVQQVGTAIKARAWKQGTCEPVAWNISVTDSSLASGQYGLAGFSSASQSSYNYFEIDTVPAQSGNVAMLQECSGVQYDGCTLESSDTVQWVLLGSNTVWEGGSIYDGTPSTSSGLQVGQQAGETAYAGQIFATSGLTNGMAPIHNRISTYITDCQGDNGSLWLDNDGGFNVFDLSINQDLKGIDRTGSLSLQSVLRESYDDGTHFPGTTSGILQLDSSVQIQKASTIYSGSGAPASSLGSNGDFYFRDDTPGTANQRVYVRSGGSWTGIV